MIKSITRRRKIATTLLMIGLLIGLIYSIFPFLWMISTSLKPNHEVFAIPQTLIPQDPTLDAYDTIFHSSTRMRYFLNSIIVSLVVTILTLIISIFAGYAFSRFEFKGKKLMNMFIINTQAIPPIALMIPYFSMIVMMNLHDTLWALILTYLVFTLPYGVLMMTGYFNTINKALDEAVMVDGGSSMTILWKILVPISLPGIVATAVYTFILSWNEYLYALTLTQSQSMRTVPVGIQLLIGEHFYVWNEMMAMSFLGSIPVLIIYLFCQKYVVAGMTAGSVKS